MPFLISSSTLQNSDEERGLTNIRVNCSTVRGLSFVVDLIGSHLPASTADLAYRPSLLLPPKTATETA